MTERLKRQQHSCWHHVDPATRRGGPGVCDHTCSELSTGAEEQAVWGVSLTLPSVLRRVLPSVSLSPGC